MDADRIEVEANRSIKDRLEGNSTAGPGRRGLVAGERVGEVSEERVTELQRKSYEASQSVRGRGGERDLRVQLTRTVYAPRVEYRPPAMRSNVAKPLGKSVIAQAPAPEKVSSTVSKKKVHQKLESVESFLQSLGLDECLITFQAAEVDMADLLYMRDGDLKALGIPTGPRNKILMELKSKRIDVGLSASCFEDQINC